MCAYTARSYEHNATFLWMELIPSSETEFIPYELFIANTGYFEYMSSHVSKIVFEVGRTDGNCIEASTMPLTMPRRRTAKECPVACLSLSSDFECQRIFRKLDGGRADVRKAH